MFLIPKYIVIPSILLMEDRVKEEVRMIAETHKPEPLSDKIVTVHSPLRSNQRGTASRATNSRTVAIM